MNKNNIIKRLQWVLMVIFRRSFTIWQSLGIHVTRNHFYEPIPDTRTLNETIWSDKSNLSGIDMNENSMIKLLHSFSKYKEEYDNFPKYSDLPNKYFLKNGLFGALDAEIYYCMIRHFKPKHIIEIGSGFSTLLAAEAIIKNQDLHGTKCELISIEPYPNKNLEKGFPGLSELIISKVEDVDLSLFNKLGNNDILFIDSSHVLKIGNDVQYEFLKIIPGLNKGVFIHFHDIFLPMEYPKNWVLNEHRFWTEQYLLQTFLMFNHEFKVIWGSNYMNINYSNELAKSFSSYKKTDYAAGSFWIKRE